MTMGKRWGDALSSVDKSVRALSLVVWCGVVCSGDGSLTCMGCPWIYFWAIRLDFSFAVVWREEGWGVLYELGRLEGVIICWVDGSAELGQLMMKEHDHLERGVSLSLLRG